MVMVYLQLGQPFYTLNKVPEATMVIRIVFRGETSVLKGGLLVSFARQKMACLKWSPNNELKKRQPTVYLNKSFNLFNIKETSYNEPVSIALQCAASVFHLRCWAEITSAR